MYNNKTKTPNSNDEESDGGSSGKGMLWPGIHSVIETFYNDIENFETYWSTAEGTLKQTNLGRHLYKPPTCKNKTDCSKNNSLHWIFQLAFQGTDAEHVVKTLCKSYEYSGVHTAKALKTYYRSDNHQQEVQHRLQKKLNNLKYNQDPESFESIQSYTNEFKTTYKRFKMANEYWPSTKRKAEYLRNINIAYGHPLMTMKPIVVRIIISLSSLPLT